jgi:hypothetical protein
VIECAYAFAWEYTAPHAFRRMAHLELGGTVDRLHATFGAGELGCFTPADGARSRIIERRFRPASRGRGARA